MHPINDFLILLQLTYLIQLSKMLNISRKLWRLYNKNTRDLHLGVCFQSAVSLCWRLVTQSLYVISLCHSISLIVHESGLMKKGCNLTVWVNHFQFAVWPGCRPTNKWLMYPTLSHCTWKRAEDGTAEPHSSLCQRLNCECGTIVTNKVLWGIWFLFFMFTFMSPWEAM